MKTKKKTTTVTKYSHNKKSERLTKNKSDKSCNKLTISNGLELQILILHQIYLDNLNRLSGGEHNHEIFKKLLSCVLASEEELFSELPWNKGCMFDGSLKQFAMETEIKSNKLKDHAKIVVDKYELYEVALNEEHSNGDYVEDLFYTFLNSYDELLAGLISEWKIRRYPKDYKQFDKGELQLIDWLLIHCLEIKNCKNEYEPIGDNLVAEQILDFVLQSNEEIFKVSECFGYYGIRGSNGFSISPSIGIHGRTTREYSVVLHDLICNINGIRKIIESDLRPEYGDDNRKSKKLRYEYNALLRKFWDLFPDLIHSIIANWLEKKYPIIESQYS